MIKNKAVVVHIIVSGSETPNADEVAQKLQDIIEGFDSVLHVAIDVQDDDSDVGP